MKKLFALLLTVALLLSFTACGGVGDDSTASLSVCLSAEPDSLDPALSSTVAGASVLAHLYSGLAKWSENEKGDNIVVADAAEELSDGTVNNDGTVSYIYKLRNTLKWSDGKAVTAADFVYAWNRAASPKASNVKSNMFDAIARDSTGKLAVKALDKRTLEVTLLRQTAYWNELLASSAYYPVRKDVVSDKLWASEASSYVSNGAYELAAWEHDNVITLQKNNSYYDAESVTMSELNFYLCDDAETILTKFTNGEWLFVDNIPTSELRILKETNGEQLKSEGQPGTYFLSWNINSDILPADSSLKGADAEKARAEIRSAIALLIDRNYIVDKISCAGEMPASTFIPKGITTPTGSQFYQSAGKASDYYGYFNISDDDKVFAENYSSAISTLKKYYKFNEESGKFLNAPALTYIYYVNESQQAVAEYIQGALSLLGINIRIIGKQWDDFIETARDGDYDIACGGWLADYNDPLSFLDIWTTASANNNIHFGDGAHKDIAVYNLNLTDYGIELTVENGTWAETYDALIRKINTADDINLRYKLMHAAEDMLMETGCITPIYYYTDVYLLDSSVQGFYCSPFGDKYFMNCTIAK